MNLKSWQDERKTILGLHKSILLGVARSIKSKLKSSADEYFKIIQYFLLISEQEKQLSKLFLKNCSYMTEIKKNYQDSGTEFFNLCDGIESYEINYAKERQNIAKTIKDSVDGAIYKEINTKVQKFEDSVNKKLKK